MRTNSSQNPILSRLKEFPHVRPELKPPTASKAPKAIVHHGGGMARMAMPKAFHVSGGGRPNLSEGRIAQTAQLRVALTDTQLSLAQYKLRRAENFLNEMSQEEENQ